MPPSLRGFLKPLGAMADTKADETPVDAPGVTALRLPLAVKVDDVEGRQFLDVSLDSNDKYALIFIRQGKAIDRVELGPIPAHRRKPGLCSYTVDVPSRAVRDGFDTVLVAPAAGDDTYAVGHLLLSGYPPTQAELDKRVAIRDGMVKQ